MTYLVMESHPAYIVALDEQGRFLRAANLGYAPGDRLTELVELTPAEQKRKRTHWPAALAAAACLCAMLLTGWNLMFAAYGTIRIRINPDVELTVNRLDYVLEARGLNPDGAALLENWNHTFKKAEEASSQLTKLAEERGYLEETGTVRLAVDSEHTAWKTRLEAELVTALEGELPPSATLVPLPMEELEVDDWDDEDDRDEEDREDPDEPDTDEDAADEEDEDTESDGEDSDDLDAQDDSDDEDDTDGEDDETEDSDNEEESD